jgi:hypothetical protein
MIAAEAADGSSFPTDEGGHPVIDCRPLLVGDDAHSAGDRGGVSGATAVDSTAAAAVMATARQQMLSALIDRGYFYAFVGDVLPPELIARVYEQSTRAHSLPRELLKREYADRLAPYRGFSDTEPRYDAAETSLCCSFDFGRDVPRLPPDDPDHEYCGPNVYPDREVRCR